MYTPTNAQPAALPTRASYVRPGLYHYAPAPYIGRRRYGQGRSMAAMLAAKGYGPAAAKRYLAHNARRMARGLPLVWPS